MQKYTTHSISSTINLPESVTSEEVGEIYFTAWTKGLKGITVYRQGSRDGVINKIKTDLRPKHITYTNAPRRPDSLVCDVHFSNIKGQELVIFVSLLNGIPYEIFGGYRQDIPIPFKNKTAWIVRNIRDEKRRRKYDLYITDPSDKTSVPFLKDIGSICKPEQAFHTRMISTALRHGTPCRFICEQLYIASPYDMI